LAENFFLSLLNVLEHAEARTSGDSQIIQFIVANHFLLGVLGTEWHSKHIALSATPDPWMLNATDAWYDANQPHETARRSVFSHRVVRLADAIFTLLKHEVAGSESLRRRLQASHHVQPTFVEIEIASFLAHNGADVRVIEGSGIRGLDFDFLAISDGMEVSVEVTTLPYRRLTVQTFLNKLKEKRDQVPPNRPAVLYMAIPSEWMTDSIVAFATFTAAAERFMKRSRRYNAFTLVWEEVRPFGAGRITRLVMRTCYHNNPRHRLSGTTVFDMKLDESGKRMADSIEEFLEGVRKKRAP
jgi:hypothetical protein